VALKIYVFCEGISCVLSVYVQCTCYARVNSSSSCEPAYNVKSDWKVWCGSPKHTAWTSDRM